MGNILQRSGNQLAGNLPAQEEPADLARTMSASPGGLTGAAPAAPSGMDKVRIEYQIAGKEGKPEKLRCSLPPVLAGLQRRLARKIDVDRPETLHLTHVREGGVRAPIVDALDYDVFLQRAKSSPTNLVVEVTVFSTSTATTSVQPAVPPTKKRKRSASSSPNAGELPGNLSSDLGERKKKRRLKKQMLRKAKDDGRSIQGAAGDTSSVSSSPSSTASSTPSPKAKSKPPNPATPTPAIKSRIAADRFKPAKSSPLTRPVVFSDPLEGEEVSGPSIAAAPAAVPAGTVKKKKKSSKKSKSTFTTTSTAAPPPASASASPSEAVPSSARAVQEEGPTPSSSESIESVRSLAPSEISSPASVRARPKKGLPKPKPQVKGPGADALAAYRASLALKAADKSPAAVGTNGSSDAAPAASLADAAGQPAATAAAGATAANGLRASASPPPAQDAKATTSDTPKQDQKKKKKQKISTLEIPSPAATLPPAPLKASDKPAPAEPRGRKRKAVAETEQTTIKASSLAPAPAAAPTIRPSVPAGPVATAAPFVEAASSGPAAAQVDLSDESSEEDEDAEYSPIESDDEPKSQRRTSQRRLFRRSPSSDAVVASDDEDSISAGSADSAPRSAIDDIAPAVSTAESIDADGDEIVDEDPLATSGASESAGRDSSRGPSSVASERSQHDSHMPAPTATPPHNTGTVAYLDAMAMEDEDEDADDPMRGGMDSEDNKSRTSSRAASESLVKAAQTESPSSALASNDKHPPSTPLARGPSSPASSNGRDPLQADDLASQPTPTPKERPGKGLRVGIPPQKVQRTSLVSPRDASDRNIEAASSNATGHEIASSSAASPAVPASIADESANSERDELAPSTAQTSLESETDAQPRALGQADKSHGNRQVDGKNHVDEADDGSAASAGSDAPAFPSSIFGGRQVTKAKQNARQSARASCILCDAIPQHLQNRCPIIIGGLPSIEQRLKELERDAPDSPGIEALQAWREKTLRADRKSKSSTDSPGVEQAPGTAPVDSAVASPALDVEATDVVPPKPDAKRDEAPPNLTGAGSPQTPEDSAAPVAVAEELLPSATTSLSAQVPTQPSAIPPSGKAGADEAVQSSQFKSSNPNQDSGSDSDSSSDLDSDSDTDASEGDSKGPANEFIAKPLMRTLSFPAIPSQAPSSRRSVISLSDLRPEDLKRRPARSVSSQAGSLSGRASASAAGSAADTDSDDDSSSSGSSSSSDSSDEEQANLAPEIQARYVNGSSKRRDSKLHGAEKTW